MPTTAPSALRSAGIPSTSAPSSRGRFGAGSARAEQHRGPRATRRLPTRESRQQRRTEGEHTIPRSPGERAATRRRRRLRLQRRPGRRRAPHEPRSCQRRHARCSSRRSLLRCRTREERLSRGRRTGGARRGRRRALGWSRRLYSPCHRRRIDWGRDRGICRRHPRPERRRGTRVPSRRSCVRFEIVCVCSSLREREPRPRRHPGATPSATPGA